MSVSISIKKVNFNRLINFLMILLKHIKSILNYFVTLAKLYD